MGKFALIGFWNPNILKSKQSSTVLPAMTWRDEYTTAMSTGTINGTPAEPGPETRNVTDTTGRMILSGGSLIWKGGTGVYGDPGILYTATTRQAGKSLWFTSIVPGGSIMGPLGWIRADGFSTNRGNIQKSSNYLYDGVGGPLIGNWTASKQQQFGIILRTVGHYIFGKSDDFDGGVWNLVWANKSSSGNPTPGLINYNISGSFDFMRCPAQSISVTPLTADSFNRADGAIGSTDGTETYETAPSGFVWTNQVNTWGISSNKAQPSSITGSYALATINAGETDVLLDVLPTRSTGTVGLVFWYTDADNFGRIVNDGTNLKLIRRVGGVDQAAEGSVASTIGRISVSISGTTVRFAITNAANVVTVSTLTPTTKFGIFSDNVGNTVDDFTVWHRRAGAYSAFDAFFR